MQLSDMSGYISSDRSCIGNAVLSNLTPGAKCNSYIKSNWQCESDVSGGDHRGEVGSASD